MGDKRDERIVLNALLQDKPKCEIGKAIKRDLKGIVFESERPDFIINGIGIEHFLVDMIFEKKHKSAMSLDRKTQNAINDKVDYYNAHPDLLDEDIHNEKVVDFLCQTINDGIFGISKFSCKKFIENFKNIYDSHYANRMSYMEKCQKLVFLIEIPYFPPLNRSGKGYKLKTMGRLYRQSVRTIPIPNQIVEHIQKNNDVDFVIFVIHPIYRNDEEKKNCQVIYINPRAIDFHKQSVTLCDEFDYPIKFPCKDIVKTNVEKAERGDTK